MNASIFSFSPNFESIFKAQNQSLITINLAPKDKPVDIVEVTKANVTASFAEVKKEFDGISFYPVPTFDNDFLDLRTSLQTKAQSDMRAEASRVERMSGGYGSHVIKAAEVIREEVNSKVRDLADKHGKNKQKYNYIIEMIEANTNQWLEVITKMEADGIINSSDHQVLSEFLNSIRDGTLKSINIKLL